VGQNLKGGRPASLNIRTIKIRTIFPVDNFKGSPLWLFLPFPAFDCVHIFYCLNGTGKCIILKQNNIIISEGMFVRSLISNTAIEPLAHLLQAVDWTKIATVFQEFYDLRNKAEMNYNLYAILDDEENDWIEEPKILLSDVAKILLWSRRKQWKDKILKVA